MSYSGESNGPLQDLSQEKLDALDGSIRDDENEDIRKAKRLFAAHNMAGGLLNLFQAFSESGFIPKLIVEEMDGDGVAIKWRINFSGHGFQLVSLQPSPYVNTVVQADSDGEKTLYSVLRHPETWASIIRDSWEWVKDYREGKYNPWKSIENVNFLEPLDRAILHALSMPGCLSDSDYLRKAKEDLLNNRSLASGVLNLFKAFGIFGPELKEATGPGKIPWRVCFHVSISSRATKPL